MSNKQLNKKKWALIHVKKLHEMTRHHRIRPGQRFKGKWTEFDDSKSGEKKNDENRFGTGHSVLLFQNHKRGSSLRVRIQP